MKQAQVYLLLFILPLLFGCKKDKSQTPPPIPNPVIGYLYSCNNLSNGNGVVAMAVSQNGEISELLDSPFECGDRGNSELSSIISQGAMAIYQDLLICPNPGPKPSFQDNGSLSVFRIAKDGSLSQIDQYPDNPENLNLDSEGEAPASIDIIEKDGQIWVLVANQYRRHKPNGIIVNTDLRNLAAFKLDPIGGRLSFVKILASYFDGEIGRIGQVKADPSQNLLVVTTFGILYDIEDVKDTLSQRPRRVYLYQIDADATNINLIPTNTPYFSKDGIAAAVSIVWRKNEPYFYVTNANLTPGSRKFNISIFQAKTNQPQLIGYGNAPAAISTSCWSTLSQNNQNLYISDTHNALIDFYQVGSNPNELSYSSGTKIQTPEEGQVIDILLHPNQKYLYALESTVRHAIHIFEIGADGIPLEATYSPLIIPSAKPNPQELQRFFGLVYYPKP